MKRSKWEDQVRLWGASIKFMTDVSNLLGCIPSFADPSLDGDNSHIKKRIQDLLDLEAKTNQKERIIDHE